MNKLFMNKLISFILLLPFCFLLHACWSDVGKDKKGKDCSVAPRCESESDLAIRLRQVETYFFELESDEKTSYVDLAQFDYNENDQWIGGVTTRVAESDFDYLIEYGLDGKMSKSTKRYFDDFDNTAIVIIDYSYDINEQLDRSDSHTEIRDQEDDLVKTINETFDYNFTNGLLNKIIFSVDDSVLDISSFDYEFTYEDKRIKEIFIRQQVPAKPDFLFRSFEYNDAGNVRSSKSYRLNSSNELIEQESVTYEYYIDGPLKIKTALTNSTPKQKIETHYKWEAGACATNQTYGDRLFPTPEVINFPCL